MRGFRLCAWPLLVIAVVLAVVSVYYTVTHLAIHTSRNDLVASNQHLIQRTEAMDRAFGGRDGMVVVVENGHPKRAIKFADDLAAQLRRYPDHFPEIFYHIDPETFKRSALLYLEPQELDKIKTRLLEQQDLLSGLAADPRLTTFYGLVNDRIARAMIGEIFTGFLADEEKLELPDLSLLNASLRGLAASLEGRQPQTSLFSSFFPKELSDFEESGYFFTENDKYLLFLVTPKGDGYASRSQDLALLRQVVDQVKARYPGLQAGVTGPDALEADEMSSSMQDVTLATWLSLARPDGTADPVSPESEAHPGGGVGADSGSLLDLWAGHPGGGPPQPPLPDLRTPHAGPHHRLRHPLVLPPGRRARLRWATAAPRC